MGNDDLLSFFCDVPYSPDADSGCTTPLLSDSEQDVQQDMALEFDAVADIAFRPDFYYLDQSIISSSDCQEVTPASGGPAKKLKSDCSLSSHRSEIDQPEQKSHPPAKRKRYKHRNQKEHSIDALLALSHLPQKVAAAEFGMNLTYFKNLCRNHGLARWPYRQVASAERKREKLSQHLSFLQTREELRPFASSKQKDKEAAACHHPDMSYARSTESRPSPDLMSAKQHPSWTTESCIFDVQKYNSPRERSLRLQTLSKCEGFIKVERGDQPEVSNIMQDYADYMDYFPSSLSSGPGVDLLSVMQNAY